MLKILLLLRKNVVQGLGDVIAFAAGAPLIRLNRFFRRLGFGEARFRARFGGDLPPEIPCFQLRSSLAGLLLRAAADLVGFLICLRFLVFFVFLALGAEELRVMRRLGKRVRPEVPDFALCCLFELFGLLPRALSDLCRLPLCVLRKIGSALSPNGFAA